MLVFRFDLIHNVQCSVHSWAHQQFQIKFKTYQITRENSIFSRNNCIILYDHDIWEKKYPLNRIFNSIYLSWFLVTREKENGTRENVLKKKKNQSRCYVLARCSFYVNEHSIFKWFSLHSCWIGKIEMNGIAIALHWKWTKL